MIIGKATAQNFQSFENIEFDYSNQGLSLISGPTGAGKSTVMDLAAWLLYGISSKDLAASEVMSWTAETNTEGTIEVTLPDGVINITRIRSRTSSQNDLFYIEASNPDTKIRGSNLLDTQRLIDQRLGVNAELFLLGSYLHQFSKSDSFFIAKAKERRETLESIADLSLAVRLAESASKARKDTKKELEAQALHESKEKGRAEELARNIVSFQGSKELYETSREIKLKGLQKSRDNFNLDLESKLDKLIAQLSQLDKIILPEEEFTARNDQIKTQMRALLDVRSKHKVEDKRLRDVQVELKTVARELNQLDSLEGQCPTCLANTGDNVNLNEHKTTTTHKVGTLRALEASQQKIVSDLEAALELDDKLKAAYEKLLADKANNTRLIDKFESLQAEVIGLRHAENHYQKQIEEVKAEVNPFDAKIVETEKLILDTGYRLQALSEEIKALEHRVASLTWLYDKSFELRGALMSKAVKEINDSVNAYLEKFFDASIRVFFKLTDSEKLDVEIFNNGYSCSFKQLSGGERRMLALTFSISLMKSAQNRAGISFNCIMIDEGLNGLSSDLKVKAFDLLQSLENDYSSVFLIDHDEELKNMFTNRFIVEKTGDTSTIIQSV